MLSVKHIRVTIITIPLARSPHSLLLTGTTLCHVLQCPFQSSCQAFTIFSSDFLIVIEEIVAGPVIVLDPLPILALLTIEAHYNDQLPETMQSLALYLDTDHLDGVLGDFTFGSVPDFEHGHRPDSANGDHVEASRRSIGAFCLALDLIGQNRRNR